MKINLYKKLRKSLSLGIQIAKADFKLRNEGSYLGIFWYLLNPILTFFFLFIIFSDRLGNTIPYYVLYLLLGIIMFNFFQSTTIDSTRAILKDNIGIIKSINFPRESLIIAIIIKGLFSHFFEVILFFVLYFYFRLPPPGIFFYALILLLFCIFIFGICLILSSLTVFFADLENIWNFGVRILWLITPIFYSIEGGQLKLFYLNLLNPVYYFITISRDLIIYEKLPQPYLVLGAFFYSMLFLLLGLVIFNKFRDKFAELI